MSGMAWGRVEIEPEVERWLGELSDDEFGQAAFYIDLLADRGVALGEPYTKQLVGKLRELRFYLGRRRVRVTYFIASSRRIILLTVFAKTRAREQAEVKRAHRAMKRCIEEDHSVEDG